MLWFVHIFILFLFVYFVICLCLFVFTFVFEFLTCLLGVFVSLLGYAGLVFAILVISFVTCFVG